VKLRTGHRDGLVTNGSVKDALVFLERVLEVRVVRIHEVFFTSVLDKLITFGCPREPHVIKYLSVCHLTSSQIRIEAFDEVVLRRVEEVAVRLTFVASLPQNGSPAPVVDVTAGNGAQNCFRCVDAVREVVLVTKRLKCLGGSGLPFGRSRGLGLLSRGENVGQLDDLSLLSRAVNVGEVNHEPQRVALSSDFDVAATHDDFTRFSVAGRAARRGFNTSDIVTTALERSASTTAASGLCSAKHGSCRATNRKGHSFGLCGFEPVETPAVQLLGDAQQERPVTCLARGPEEKERRATET
jgi:hypothetical protein